MLKLFSTIVYKADIVYNCSGNRDGEESDPKTVHGDGEGFVNTGCVYCGNDHEEFL